MYNYYQSNDPCFKNKNGKIRREKIVLIKKNLVLQSKIKKRRIKSKNVFRNIVESWGGKKEEPLTDSQHITNRNCGQKLKSLITFVSALHL